MGARVLTLPLSSEPASRRPLPDESAARAAVALGLHALRQLRGRSAEEWAAELGAALGRPITAELVLAWEDPEGPKPPAHWWLMAHWLAGPLGLDVASRLLLT